MNDYLRLAIEWLPPVLGGAMIGVWVSKLFTRIERGATEEEIAARSRHPTFTRRFRQNADMVPLIALLLPAVYYAVLSFFRDVEPVKLYLGWAPVGGMLWFVLMGWYVREPKMVRHWSAPWLMFTMVFPALAISAFCWGLYAGKTKTPLLSQLSDVQLSVKDQATPLAGRILFLLDEYVVLGGQQTGHGVIVLPKAEVTKIVYSADN